MNIRYLLYEGVYRILTNPTSLIQMVTLSSFFLFCPATFLYDMDFFGEIRNMSIFGTKYRFKWQAIAFQLDIDITFAECLKTEIWQISARE